MTPPLAVRNQSAFSAPYPSESYQRRACSMVGTSVTTMRLGFQSPSSVGTWPPRTRNLPPYFSTVPGTCFRYSSNPAGSVTSFVDDEIRWHVRTSSSRRRELSHSSDVPHRRLAEVPLVLAVEVRGIVVTDSVAGFRRVEIFAEHEAPGLLKPQLLSGTAS